MNTFVFKRNLYKVANDLYAISKKHESLGIMNDDKRVKATLNEYLFKTNAVNINAEQYALMYYITSSCWYYNRKAFNCAINKVFNYADRKAIQVSND